MTMGRRLKIGLDDLLESSVFGSFTRIGPAVRRRIFRWEPLSSHRMDGRVAVVTGASSGLGLETAMELARLGCRVFLLVRDTERGAAVRARIIAATGNAEIAVVGVDMGDLESVRRAAADLRQLPAIDVLVHNAGTLSRTLQITPQGIEQTIASQLVGPFLLTHLLGGQLRARPSRVIFVSSGGMYLQPLDVSRLVTPSGDYDGVRAYARAKRAQVSLVARWAPRLKDLGVTMLAMHPGWADTPGMRTSLPGFHRFTRPFLRSPTEGADTTVWLASTGDVDAGAESVWLDRGPRGLHRTARTRRTDTGSEREALWQFCTEHSGIEDAELELLS